MDLKLCQIEARNVTAPVEGMEQLIEQVTWFDMSGQIFTLLDSASIVCAAGQLRGTVDGSDLNINA